MIFSKLKIDFLRLGRIQTASSGREFVIIQPGGSATFASGVKVALSTASTDTPLEIFSEEVPATATTIPIPDDY